MLLLMKIHLANSKFLKAVRSAFKNFKMQVHKNFTILLLLVLSVSGKNKSDLQNDKPQDYTFSYGVNDAHTGDNKSQWEKKEGDKVTGSYSVAEPDGSIRTVEYTADDKNGFKAVVKYSRPANKVQKNSLGPTKIQLDHIDVNSISADHVSSIQPIDTTSILETQPIKTDFEISTNQYEDKPVIDKWSPIISKPQGFQTIIQQELANVHSTAPYISSAVLNDEHNINIEKPSYTSLPNREIINPVDSNLNFNQQQTLYPVYQYQHRDTRDSQKYQNTQFQPITSSTRSQRSNKRLEATYKSAPHISSSAPSAASGLQYTADTANQYKIINPSQTVNYLQDVSSWHPIQKMIPNDVSKTNPAHTVNYLQDVSSWHPTQNMIPIDVSKTNLVESNLKPNQQKHFYPWYKYDETQKLQYANFQPLTSQLSETGYKSPYYGNVAIPGIRNYGPSVMTQYPIIRNNYGQNQDSNNFPSFIINKQLGRHPQVNVQKSKFGRLHPRSLSNREYVKYAKTVTYGEY